VKVGIYGAGSIGNHLAFSSRRIGANVTVCDISADALARFQNLIYPSRYGEFDSEIVLVRPDEFLNSKFDVIFIGTPPETHLELLERAIDADPRVICVEKPVVTPDLKEIKSFAKIIDSAKPIILAGYNHRVGRNTTIALDLIERYELGIIQRLESVVLESWDGILSAHPWLNGPENSYLGFTNRGGGATFEHSHGIDLWCFYAEKLGLGDIQSVDARAKFVTNRVGGEYDEEIEIEIETVNGVSGIIRQDVKTTSAQKWVEIIGNLGSIKSQVGIQPNKDSVEWCSTIDPKISINCTISKTRYDDFDRELLEISRLISVNKYETQSSPLSARSALRTALVAAASLHSARISKPVILDFDNWNFCPR